MTCSRSSITKVSLKKPDLVVVHASMIISTLEVFTNDVAFQSTWRMAMEFLLRAYDLSENDSAPQSIPKSCMTSFTGSFLSHTHTCMCTYMHTPQIWSKVSHLIWIQFSFQQKNPESRLKTKWHSGQNLILLSFLYFFILPYDKKTISVLIDTQI